MASFSISSYTETRVTIQVTGLTEGDTVRFFIRLYSDTSDTTVDSKYTATSSTMSKRFSGLTSGTRYAVNVQVNGTWLGAKNFTTDEEEDTGSFSIPSSSITSNSVRVTISYPSSASYARVFITDTSGNNVGSGDSVSGFITSTSFTYSNLQPQTTYYVNVYFYTSASSSSIYYQCTKKSFTTLEPEIEYWSWTSSNGSATAAQTKAAYTAVTGKGELSDFSYKVWNDMVEKVSEVLVAKGFSSNWNEQYTTKANTLMSSTDKDLTALRFNSLRYNIGANYSTGISEVDKGDIVYGSYFITLMEALNNWIG